MTSALAGIGTKAMANSIINKTKSQFQSQSQSKQAINWQDFNYPPLLHIIHYKLGELQQPVKRVVLMIWLSFFFISLVSIINFINTIILVSVYSPAINMLYTILNILIFLPLSMIVFYWGYRGICYRPKQDSVLLKYRIMQGIVAILWFVFSILNKGCFNGFAKFSELMDQNLHFSLFLAVIESLLYLTSAGLGVLCIFKSRSVEDEDPTGKQKYSTQQI